VNYVQILTRYKSWADELFFAALANLPEPELVAPRPIAFGSIIRTMNHVCAMDQVWRAHLEDKSHGFVTRNPDACPPFAELRKAQQLSDAWFVDYADSLTVSACDEVMNFTFIGGGSGAMSRANILLHVVNHTTYHRGHVADMMYQIGAQPPTTDLPVFLRDRN
jgi:uncharacterized damage-inducible protein DinB